MNAMTRVRVPAETLGDHGLYRLLERLRTTLAEAAPEDRARLVLGLVRLEFGEGVAKALEGRR